MLTYTSNFTLTPPSAAAAGGKIKMQDSSNHPATMVAMILPAAVCLVVVIALLLYHYYRRASGPVWIPKVLMNSSCTCKLCILKELCHVSIRGTTGITVKLRKP